MKRLTGMLLLLALLATSGCIVRPLVPWGYRHHPHHHGSYDDGRWGDRGHHD